MLHTKRPTQNGDSEAPILIHKTMMCTAAYIVKFYTVDAF